MNTTTYFR